eukprot:12761100-Alexandrium_andersonii.AAC.1
MAAGRGQQWRGLARRPPQRPAMPRPSGAPDPAQGGPQPLHGGPTGRPEPRSAAAGRSGPRHLGGCPAGW